MTNHIWCTEVRKNLIEIRVRFAQGESSESVSSILNLPVDELRQIECVCALENDGETSRKFVRLKDDLRPGKKLATWTKAISEAENELAEGLAGKGSTKSKRDNVRAEEYRRVEAMLISAKEEISRELQEQIEKTCRKRTYKEMKVDEQSISHSNYKLHWLIDGADIVFRYCSIASDSCLFSERWQPLMKVVEKQKTLLWSRRYGDNTMTTSDLAQHAVQTFKTTIDAWQAARAKGFSKKAMKEMLRILHEDE